MEAERVGCLVWGLGFIALVVVVGITNLVSCNQEREAAEKRKQAIAAMVSKYDAVRDWDKGFDDGRVVLKKGVRLVYTEDIERALIKTDKKPVLIVGYIYEAKRVGSKHFLGIAAYEHKALDLSFMLSCSEGLFKKALAQHTDDGFYFAVIVQADAVLRPAFEADAYEYDEDISVIIEPTDKYIITGTCLDMLYIGEHD